MKQLGSGSTFKEISKDKLEMIKFTLPPISLQQKFTVLAEKVELLRAKQKQSEQELDIFFNSLMKKAFNGELVS